MNRILLTLGALAMFAPAAALASPHVHVGVAAPTIVARAPAIEVAVRPVRPGPAYVWVDGYYTRDHHGRAVWVDGYWKARPAPARVVTIATPVVKVRTVRR